MGDRISVGGIMIPIGTHEGKLIILGSDHRGFDYKKRIAELLGKSSYNILNVGTYSKERCDYPEISDKIGRFIGEDVYNRVGIGICGSGVGILIPASKVKGVYAARCLSVDDAVNSRKHNNSNLLGLSADILDFESIQKIIEAWLTAPFYSNQEEEVYLNRFLQTVRLEDKI
jgi:ribose 5-phosphate isomerase B